MSETDAAALLGRIGDSISGHRSFGPAFEKDGILVVPVAYVFGGGGGGESDEPAKPEARKKGSGGGYGLVSWPIGAYVVQDGQVRWVPVIDPGLMMTTGALAIAVVIKSLRRKRRRVHRRDDR
jgi:uncharacterized spore protein YtfJ